MLKGFLLRIKSTNDGLGFVVDHEVDINEEELIFIGHLSEKEPGLGVVPRDGAANDHIVRIEASGIGTSLELSVLQHIIVIKIDKGLGH